MAEPLQLLKHLVHYAQPWQTFFAAMVALCAATLAYRGAMAKISFDKSGADQAHINRKLGLFLRLHASLLKMVFDLQRIVDLIGPPNTENEPQIVNPSRVLKYSRPAELDEAWAAVELMPPDLVQPLQMLRESSNIYDLFLDMLKDESFNPPPTEALHHYQHVCERMLERATKIRTGLERSIEVLRTKAA